MRSDRDFDVNTENVKVLSFVIIGELNLFVKQLGGDFEGIQCGNNQNE